MSATPIASRTAINRANSLHSTGPRTASGKQRSALNALRHGLTAASAVLPCEDQAAFDTHRRGFFDEYQPATPTETQLVQELADTSWRLNRIPLLEANLLSRAANPPTEQAAIEFDIVDAHRLLANLGIQGQRLSRQFQKTSSLTAISSRVISPAARSLEKRSLRLCASRRRTAMERSNRLPTPGQNPFSFSMAAIARFVFSKRSISVMTAGLSP
jgi:hypothetical protein